MKKILYLLFCLFCIPAIIFAQPNFSQFLNNIQPISASTTRQAMVDSFITAVKNSTGGPVINGDTATFLYQGTSYPVLVSGDFNNWGTSTTMDLLPGTNLFYYRSAFEMNARLDYKFILTGNNYILDPLNSHYCNGGYGPNSELAMPSYIQPWEILSRNIPHGTLLIKTISSTYLSANYQIHILLPPGYSATDARKYPSIYFHDGQDYLNLASAQNVISNVLDSGKIQPFIGVFITPNNRNDEMMGTKRDAYRLFIVKELVPYIDTNYNTLKTADSRIMIGTSLGGNITALIVYHHPDVFGKCGLHSAAFWVNNFEASTQLLAAPPKNVQYYAAWGTYEDTYEWMRPFRDSLLKQNFRFGWSERPEGHSWGLWRATLDSMLRFLVPAIPNSIRGQVQKQALNFSLSSAYPNPFNSTVSFQYTIPSDGPVDIALYDNTGRRVRTISNNQETPGTRTLRIAMNAMASGIYFLRMSFNGFVQTRSLLLLK